MSFGKLGAMGRGFGHLGSLGRSGGSTPAVPTIISASIRSRPAYQSTSYPLGLAIATNPYGYQQYREESVKAVTGIRPVYANISTTSFAIDSHLFNGNQEQGCGGTISIRGTVVTNVQGTTGNQTGATFTPLTFADAANDTAIVVGSQTVSGCIWKLDNTTTPPTYTRKTYAQFVADGGSVSSSTIDGVTVANTQAAVPYAYKIIADAGPNIAAKTAYLLRLEDRVPVITVTSIDGTVANTLVVSTTNTDVVRAGDVPTVASGTGNTSANGTWLVASVVANTSITLTTTSTAGAVTGTPTLRFTRPGGGVGAQVVANPLGDFYRASVTQRDVMGNNGANWITGVGANVLTTDGTAMSHFSGVLGVDPTGGECVDGDGDSLISAVGDGSIDSPSSASTGDSSGNIGYFNRFAYRESIPVFRTSVPGMKAQNAFTKQDNRFRLWWATLCDVAYCEMGRNDALSTALYADFLTYMTTHWDRIRAVLRGRADIVGHTLSPGTTEISADHWKSGRNSTWQTFSSTTLSPAGYGVTYNAALKSTLITGAAGGIDGVLDIAQLISNLDNSSITPDWYWPVNGVNYFATIDGSHLSRSAATAIAAACTRPVIIASKMLLS